MIFRAYISIVFIVFGLSIKGQHLSPLGRFSIDYDRGCAPVTVHITSLDVLGNISRQYFYEEENTETLDTFYTYTSPGEYKIVQFLGEDVEPKTDTLIFTVLPGRAPEFLIFECSVNEFTVEITDSPYDYHTFSFQDSLFDSRETEIALSLDNMSSQLQVKGNFDDSFNEGCTSSTVNIIPFSSPVSHVIDSINLTEACKNNYQLYLEGRFDEYSKYTIDIIFNNQVSKIYEGEIISPMTLPYDMEIPADTFCVSVTKINACTKQEITKASACGHAVKHTLANENLYATYSGHNIHIPLTAIPFSYVISRSANGAAMNAIDTVTSSFIDEFNSSNRYFKYEITKIDSCDNTLWSQLVAPPYQRILSKNRLLNEVTVEHISPVSSSVRSDSTILLYNNDSTAHREIDFQTIFRLNAALGDPQFFRSTYAIMDSVEIYSNAIISSYQFLVYAPKAFTPDNDDLNDYFTFYGLPSEQGQLFIFDRWGKVIFETSSILEGWDGQINNRPAPEGSYRYKIQIPLDGEIQQQVGSFTLIRN